MTKPSTQKIQLFFSFWLITLFIALPVSYDFLPRIGNWVSNGLFDANNWFCTTFFGLDISNTYLISDSAAFYSTAIILAPTTLILLVILLKFAKINAQTTTKFCYTILIYCISFYLLRYGIDKLAGNQFYIPAPNTLHTELGNLSKDILYWSTMGVSPKYNLFMAITELFAGILLLWGRTRFIALLMSFAIFSNVLATNIGFEITVKYLSCLLLVANLLCLSYHSSQLKAIMGIKSVEETIEVVSTNNRRLILKSVIILIIGFETISQYYDIESFPKMTVKSFEITSVQSKSELLDLLQIRRIHFHGKGYMITENWEGKMKSTKILNTKNGFSIGQTPFHLNANIGVLSWRERREQKIVYLREIDLDRKAVFKKNDSWFVEKNMIN